MQPRPKQLNGRTFGKDFKVEEDISQILKYEEANKNESQVQEYYHTRSEYLKMKKEEKQIKAVRTNKAFDLMQKRVKELGENNQQDDNTTKKVFAVTSKIDNKR
mmetsp:Transcript_55966/g.121799  ORF Transcript_55966/g.121799 Transcript_55966/m.121799 type:complete len:104 (-) Transcript_55966:160-471(-)|eukprot:CAMPEP_0116958394 /NCGR_PEP_ID=MMETSP0467-20121206/44612_1 /TAXON_ID=283647 /ORGANISM="Mesodinium pulex, Strain SPMC105" /LENGTH=103 /DNA_ID=CAMNT_0004645469 /DNA_START=207 /DNA_END=521 /DNA_ORIENTATION=+